ncbi:chaperone protein dnaJ 11, chloroplastic [Rosa rugosa]|uniref:chaperone protein dnaJ 11, chloroplastic n=1 Tax=Rosa rugosa TaxID=74645 RepID=UPI002B403AC1|nr:chaperone protein dnaJ 11, chloroplastic [Rosa rugosa]
MLSAPSSTSTLFTAPLLFSATPSPKSPPRVRFHPARAFASAACASDETSTASYLAPPPTTTTASLYEILGIPAAASCHEIKTAYRRLARVCHPDVAAMERKDSSADEFMRIHDAYSTLSDPEKRAEYDRKMFRRSRPLSADYSRYYSGRNWETDQCW